MRFGELWANQILSKSGYTIDSWGMRDNAPDSGGVQGVVAVTANAMNPN